MTHPLHTGNIPMLLTDGAIQEIITADIPDVSKHDLNYDGTRAIDGGAAEFREGNSIRWRSYKI